MSTQSRRNSPPSLWEQAVTLWNNLVLGFGHPHDLMRWGWMRALEHRALGHWLRDLEALVRRAIRDDAETCELPPLKPGARRPKRPLPQSQVDMPRFRRSYSDDCTTWKVSFRMSTRGPRKRGPHKNPPPSERRRCRNLAYRIEALRRAINHRADYAMRHARRLARIEAARLSALAGYIALHDSFSPRPSPDQPTAGQPALRSAKHIEPG